MKSTIRQSGFTLIEVLIALGIAVVLTMLAIPGMKSYIASQQIKAAASDLAQTMTLARSEAIKRNCLVQVNPASGTNEWSPGWMAYDVDLEKLAGQDKYEGLRITGSAANVFVSSTGIFEQPYSFTIASTHGAAAGAAACVRVSSGGIVSTTKGACA